jgi:hypothetical protein
VLQFLPLSFEAAALDWKTLLGTRAGPWDSFERHPVAFNKHFANWKPWPIEKEDIAIKHADFHTYVG